MGTHHQALLLLTKLLRTHTQGLQAQLGDQRGGKGKDRGTHNGQGPSRTPGMGQGAPGEGRAQAQQLTWPHNTQEGLSGVLRTVHQRTSFRHNGLLLPATIAALATLLLLCSPPPQKNPQWEASRKPRHSP